MLDVLTVGSAIAGGYFSLRYLEGIGWFAMPLIFFGFFLILSFFGTLFIQDGKRRYAVMAFATAGILGFFYSLPVPLLAVASSAMLSLFFLGEAESRFAIENSIKFRFIKFAKPKFSHMVTGIVLAGVVIYAPLAEKSDAVISEPQFAKIYELTLGSVEDMYQGLRFTSTVEELATDIVRRELERDERYIALPPDAQASALREAAGKIIQNAQKGIGSIITPEMSASKFFYEYFLARMREVQKRLGPSFLFVWAAGAFLVFRSAGTVFVWVTLTVAYILYEFLFVVRMIRLRGESRTKEVVEFT